MTNVFNLRTGQTTHYTCPPEQAVVAAYAQQEKKDYNTHYYQTRYGHLVRYGRRVVTVWDYTSLWR